MKKLLFVCCIAWLLSYPAFAAKPKRLLYLPLDERFTTRDLFISFAGITDYSVVTPDKSLLPQKKNLPRVERLIDWTERAAGNADAAIISADMLLYGGLIGSRTSGENIDAVRARLKVLERLRRARPRLPIFVSTTVMRMPQFSTSDEEPDYYARWGREIFLYSQAAHRFETLKNPEDRTASETYKNKIPAAVLADYLARRERNFLINKDLIRLVENKVIDRLVITLDDNAEYGFFKKEAAELEKLSAGLRDRVAIYPGADEAQLPLLARLAGRAQPIPVYVAYRFPAARRLIPSFEGQPLDESVEQQIRAAGGTVVGGQNKAACILYVNNFADKETFAGVQFGAPEEKKVTLEQLFTEASVKIDARKIYILADNRFYNGADAQFIAAIFSSKTNSDRIAYAGWNTSGNTLGTAVAMGFLRYRLSRAAAGKSYKKLLWTRFIEDWAYMIDGREEIKKDLKRRGVSVFAGDAALEGEYEAQMKRFLNGRAEIVNRFLGTNYRVERAFFPWHRQFEIGFEISNDE